MKIIVVGGSLAGLTTALLLADQGHQVDVLERSPVPLEGRGAGIIGHPATIRYFTRSGRAARDFGVGARYLRYLDDDGGVADEQDIQLRFFSYASLYTELRTKFPQGNYHLGIEVTGFVQRHDHVEVHTSDGGSQVADLLVCADGVRSRSRKALAPAVRPNYAGYVAWRGTISRELGTDLLSSAITYKMLPNSHMLAYPIPGPTSDDHLINWLWYRNVSARELPDLLRDNHDVTHEISVAAGLVRDEHVTRLYRDARQALPGPLRDLVTGCEQPFIQVIADVEVTRMAYGRVCILGDAAFALRPHVATGTAKAAEDAWQLAAVLNGTKSADVPSRLLSWEQRQLALGRSLLARARHAGRKSQFENSWEIGMRLPFGLYRIGDSTLP